MIEGIVIGILVVIVALNVVYTFALYRYTTKLHRMVNEGFMHMADELKRKIGLREGETLAATTLHFKGVDIAKGDTDEPLDSITVLEYSVNNNNKEHKNE